MGERRSIVPYLEILFAVVVWGGSFVAVKIALRELAPAAVVWLRFGMGVLVLLAAVLLRRELAWPAHRDLPYFALLGFLGITWHQWLQSTGLQTAQATTTAWIVSTSPVFIALLGWLMLKERVRRYQWAGIALAAVGVLVVVSRGDFPALFRGQTLRSGDMLILLSAPNWAIFSILSRRGLAVQPAGRMMLYVMGLGWLFSSLLLPGSGIEDLSSVSVAGWSAILFLGIACSGLAYIAWYDGLKALPAHQVGAFLYLEPLITLFVAAWVLGEALVWPSLLGGLVILTGVWLVNRSHPKPA